jgi:hypothetical protein
MNDVKMQIATWKLLAEFTSDDPTRPALHHVDVDTTRTVLVATSGHRLIKVKFSVPTPGRIAPEGPKHVHVDPLKAIALLKANMPPELLPYEKGDAFPEYDTVFMSPRGAPAIKVGFDVGLLGSSLQAIATFAKVWRIPLHSEFKQGGADDPVQISMKNIDVEITALVMPCRL